MEENKGIENIGEEVEEEEEIGELKRIPTKTYEFKEKLHEELKSDDDEEDYVEDDDDDDDIAALERLKTATLSIFEMTTTRDTMFGGRASELYDPTLRSSLTDLFDIYLPFIPTSNPSIVSMMDRIKNSLINIGWRPYYDSINQHLLTLDETSFQALQSSRIVIFPITQDIWKKCSIVCPKQQSLPHSSRQGSQDHSATSSSLSSALATAVGGSHSANSSSSSFNLNDKCCTELYSALFYHSVDMIIPIFLEKLPIEEEELLKNKENYLLNKLWENRIEFYHSSSSSTIDLPSLANDHNELEEGSQKIKILKDSDYESRFDQLSIRTEFLYYKYPVNAMNRFPVWNHPLTILEYHQIIDIFQPKLQEISDSLHQIWRSALSTSVVTCSPSISPSTSSSSFSPLSSSLPAASPSKSKSSLDKAKVEMIHLLSPLQIALSNDISNPFDWLHWIKHFTKELPIQHYMVKICIKQCVFIYFLILLHLQQWILQYSSLYSSFALPFLPCSPLKEKEKFSVNHNSVVDKAEVYHSLLGVFYGIFPELNVLYPMKSPIDNSSYPHGLEERRKSQSKDLAAGMKEDVANTNYNYPNYTESIGEEEQEVLVIMFTKRYLQPLFFKHQVLSFVLFLSSSSHVLSDSFLLHSIEKPFLQKNPFQKIKQFTMIINNIEKRKEKILRASFRTSGLNYNFGTSTAATIEEGNIGHSMIGGVHLGEICIDYVYTLLKLFNKQFLKWKFYLNYNEIYIFLYYYEMVLLPLFYKTKDLLVEWEKYEISLVHQGPTPSSSLSITNPGTGGGGGGGGGFFSPSFSFNRSQSYDVGAALKAAFSSGPGDSTTPGKSSGSKASSFSLRLSFSNNNNNNNNGTNGGSSSRHNSHNRGDSTDQQQQQQQQIMLIKVSQGLKKIKHKTKLLIILISQTKSLIIDSFHNSFSLIEKKKCAFDNLIHSLIQQYTSSSSSSSSSSTKTLLIPRLKEIEKHEYYSQLNELAYDIRKEYKKLLLNIDRKKGRISIKLLKRQFTIAEQEIQLIIDDWNEINENLSLILYCKIFYSFKNLNHRCNSLIEAFFDYFSSQEGNLLRTALLQRRYSEPTIRSNSQGSNGGDALLLQQYPPLTLPTFSRLKGGLIEGDFLAGRRRGRSDELDFLHKRRFSINSRSSDPLSDYKGNGRNKRGKGGRKPTLSFSIPKIDSLIPHSSFNFTSMLWNVEKCFIYRLSQVPLHHTSDYLTFRRYFSMLYNIYEIRYSFLTKGQKLKIYQKSCKSIEEIAYYYKHLKTRRIVHIDWTYELEGIYRLSKLVQKFMDHFIKFYK
jgi:hypothetical protein